MPKMLKRRYVEKTVLDLAYERVEHAFDLFDTITVHFSGGKDSTACLHVALDVARKRNQLPLRVIFFDEEAIPYQTEEYVRRVANNPDITLEWYCLPVQHRNACSRQSPYWSPWDGQEQDKWVRPLPAEAITELVGFDTGGTPATRMTIPEMIGLLYPPASTGTVGVMMGIRAQESVLRLRSVSTRREENYLIHVDTSQTPTTRGNVWKVYPVYDWATEDVWTAPNLLGWDYNHAYDVMEQAGISRSAQRCSPAYGEEPLQRFHVYKTCFPEIWDKMSTRVPGANTAMRYATTELWGYGSVPEKPDGVSWEDYLIHYVTKFSSETAPHVAENIRICIAEHYEKTSDPILSEVSHPESGASWRLIQHIAMRGDLKGRRTKAMLKKGDKFNPAAWEAYHAARQAEGL